MDSDNFFYLTSAESRPTLFPRKCRILEILAPEERHDSFLLLGIEPSIDGRKISIEQEVISEIVIATKHSNESLNPLSDLPIIVYVCQIVNNRIRNTGRVSAKDLNLITIGEIYRTRNPYSLLYKIRSFLHHFCNLYGLTFSTLLL